MTQKYTTQSTLNLETAGVQLNATDSKRLARFYQDIIGLTLIKEKEGYFALGTPDEKVLIEIFPHANEKSHKTTGLYHLALLLPSKKDLGTIFRSFIELEIPLQGASNHGYSNAIYLQDPEGNGIEIYADKDLSEWDILDSGEIVGITEAMDVEDILKDAESQFDKLPNGTIMGHLHLHVSNLDETYKFYHNVLGLGAKLVMGNHALFLASGNYHHHLGTNLWQGRNLPAPSEGMQGLKAALWIADKADFEKVKENLIKYSIEFKQDGESLLFKDNSGLPIILNQKN